MEEESHPRAAESAPVEKKKTHTAKHGRTSAARQEKFNERVGLKKQQTYKRELEQQFMCTDLDVQHQSLKMVANMDHRPTIIPCNTRGLMFSVFVNYQRCYRTYGNSIPYATHGALVRVALLQHAIVVAKARSIVPASVNHSSSRVFPLELRQEWVQASRETLKNVFPWQFTILSTLGLYRYGNGYLVPTYLRSYRCVPPFRKNAGIEPAATVTYLPLPNELSWPALGLILDCLQSTSAPLPWRELWRDYCSIPGLEFQDNVTITSESAAAVCPADYRSLDRITDDVSSYGGMMIRLLKKGEGIRPVVYDGLGRQAMVVTARMAKIRFGQDFGIRGGDLDRIVEYTRPRYVSDSALFDGIASLHVERCPPTQVGAIECPEYEQYMDVGLNARCNITTLITHFGSGNS